MAGIPVKISKDIHEEVKEFVDDSSKFSNYKSFYEDAVREKLNKQDQSDQDLEDKIDKMIEEKLN